MGTLVLNGNAEMIMALDFDFVVPKGSFFLRMRAINNCFYQKSNLDTLRGYPSGCSPTIFPHIVLFIQSKYSWCVGL